MPIRRRRKRHGSSTNAAPVSAQYRNHVWAIDFQADHLDYGTGFTIASVIDEHTRLVLDDTVDVSINSEDLEGILERLSITHSFPVTLRMDNGPEVTCRALTTWAEGIVDIAFIPPGEPWRNGYVDSFHSRERDEFLNINMFPSLLHAGVELTAWHHEYDNIRRHSSLGYQAPSQYAETCTCTKPD